MEIFLKHLCSSLPNNVKLIREESGKWENACQIKAVYTIQACIGYEVYIEGRSKTQSQYDNASIMFVVEFLNIKKIWLTSCTISSHGI